MFAFPCQGPIWKPSKKEKPKGMTLKEAVESGKRFRRESGRYRKIGLSEKQWADYSVNEFYTFSKEEILAEDWEVEEEKIEITKEQFKKWFCKCENLPHVDTVWEYLKNK